MTSPNCIGKDITEEERRDFGNYISGFVDGEACFSLGLAKHSQINQQTGKVLPPSPHCALTISLRDDDSDILAQIHKFFGCGSLTHSKRKSKVVKNGIATTVEINVAIFRISHINLLHNIIVPHFEKYPLRAKKKKDFEVWREGVRLMYTVSLRTPQNNTVHKNRKWTDSEREHFISLRNELSRVRTYKSELIFLPVQKIHPIRKTIYKGFGF